MFNNDCTKYPRIFRKTYWGRHSSCDPEIIDARNRFVETHNISRVDHTSWPLGLDYICSQVPRKDHIEKYKTLDGGNVVIMSPYTPALLAEDQDVDIPGLWERYPEPLYSDEATTFIFKYAKALDLRAIIDANILKWVSMAVPEYPNLPKRDLRCVKAHIKMTRGFALELCSRGFTKKFLIRELTNRFNRYA